MTRNTFLRLLIASPLAALLPKPKPPPGVGPWRVSPNGNWLILQPSPYHRTYLIRRVPRTYYQNLDIGPWRMNRSFVCPLPEVKETT